MSPLTSVAMKTEAQSNRQAIEQASRYLAKRIGTMGRLLLAITLGVTLVGEATAGFQGNAAPPPIALSLILIHQQTCAHAPMG